MEDFRRARQPEQVSLRRIRLIEAAADLFDEEGPSGAGLNAIATRAGFTKSNVYRYFDSREHVLLELFLADYDALSTSIAAALSSISPGDVDGAAAAITGAFVDRPRCCRLITMFSSVLEANVSEATIADVKRSLMVPNGIIIAALRATLPTSGDDDCGWALAMILGLVAGLWPGIHPAPAAAAVLGKPEFAHMLLRADRDLSRAVRALLTNVAGPADALDGTGPLSREPGRDVA